MRYTITMRHGELFSVFYVMDSETGDAVISFRTREAARQWINEQEG